MSISAVCRAGLLAGLVFAASQAAEPLPIKRLAGAGIQVQDLEKARQYYTGVLGFPDTSRGKDTAFFQINDGQYLEFSAGAPENFRLQYIAMLTPDPARLAAMLRARGVTVNDGKDYISIQDPEHNEIRFVRSIGEGKAGGGFSDHLLHVGVNADNESAAMALYRDKLEFRELGRGGPSPSEIRWIIMNMPATPGDWVEVMIAAAQPAAARQHICFEVPDIQRTYKRLTEHGLPDRFKPFLAQNHRMIMNLKDPNGLRVEIMGETVAEARP